MELPARLFCLKFRQERLSFAFVSVNCQCEQLEKFALPPLDDVRPQAFDLHRLPAEGQRQTRPEHKPSPGLRVKGESRPGVSQRLDESLLYVADYLFGATVFACALRTGKEFACSL